LPVWLMCSLACFPPPSFIRLNVFSSWHLLWPIRGLRPLHCVHTCHFFAAHIRKQA
jgi:hypothetical protein